MFRSTDLHLPPHRTARMYERFKTRVSKGFSLLELMITVTILVIMLGISTPKIMHALSIGKLRSESNFLVSIIKYLQSMAALQRASYIIHLDLDTQSYYVTRGVSEGDDFEVSTDDMVGGRNDSLFAGEVSSSFEYSDPGWSSPSYSSPSSYSSGDASLPDDEFVITNRNLAGRVTLFDEDIHQLSSGVSIVKVVDGRGDEFDKGSYIIILDPKGYAVDTSVYLSTGDKGDPFYVIHIGANGIVRVTIEDSTL